MLANLLYVNGKIVNLVDYHLSSLPLLGQKQMVASLAVQVMQPSIPISKEELFRLHDIADGLRLLRDIAEAAPEMQLIQDELLIQKTSRCAWSLIHEDFNNRWQESHSDADLIRKI
jgi:hypothetical protein